MIKVKSIGYQTDTIQATVEYDLGGETYSFTVVAKASYLCGMTNEAMRDYIRSRVETERTNKLRLAIESKIGSMIDVDLEATE